MLVSREDELEDDQLVSRLKKDVGEGTRPTASTSTRSTANASRERATKGPKRPYPKRSPPSN
jgi:hypothetical protein